VYRLLRKLLFLLPPERAHAWGMGVLTALGRWPSLCRRAQRRALSAHRGTAPLDMRLSSAGLELAHPVALAAGMRDALRAQIDGKRWLVDGIAHTLEEHLRAAVDWGEGAALPRAALLCHDAMGISGPSRDILVQAAARGWPTLFTGHLPGNSPGERMVAEESAAWIRLPTHPTRTENLAIAAASDAKTVLGHSCDWTQLSRLKQHMPRLRDDLATGDCVDL